MKITDEMVEAAAKETYKLETGLEDESWYRAYGVERELWRDQSRSVLEAALAVAPEPVKVLYRSSEIREAVNVLDQLNAEGRVDDFVYDEMRSAIEDIHDCESATAVPHDEHIDHSGLIAEAEGRGCPYETCTCDGRLIRRLADALEGKN